MAWFGVGDEAAPPVLILHGGPGGRSRVPSLNWFDGLGLRCIAFDQRGCGASEPAGELAHNTLPLLVADIERLREHLGLARWAVAGGSWGALLAVAYAAQHPDRVDGLFLRSAFLGSAAEVAHFFAPWPRWLGDAGAEHLGWPRDVGDLCQTEAVPDPVRLLQAVTTASAPGTGKALGPGEAALRAGRIAQAWQAFEGAQSAAGGLAARPATRWLPEATARRPTVPPEADPLPAEPAAAAGVPASLRVQQHYLHHGCFVDDGQRSTWLATLDRSLVGRPVALVHGSADAVCALGISQALAARWPQARCAWVADAGHDMDQPAMRAALTAAAVAWAEALAAARLHAAPLSGLFQRSLR